MVKDVYPAAEPQFFGPPEDVEAVRQIHRDWWAGNHTLEVRRMSRNFASDTLMFNLNGHTYYGLDEMNTVWEFYSKSIGIEVVVLWDYRITVHGDYAYITSEGIFPVKTENEQGWGADNLEIGEQTTPVRFRETSIARRDDGQGNRVWRICHFHCSPAAASDEPRAATGGTWNGISREAGGHMPQDVELPLD